MQSWTWLSYQSYYIEPPHSPADCRLIFRQETLQMRTWSQITGSLASLSSTSSDAISIVTRTIQRVWPCVDCSSSPVTRLLAKWQTTAHFFRCPLPLLPGFISSSVIKQHNSDFVVSPCAKGTQVVHVFWIIFNTSFHIYPTLSAEWWGSSSWSSSGSKSWMSTDLW